MSGNENSGGRKSHQKSDLPYEIPRKKKRKPDRLKRVKTVITSLQKMLEINRSVLIEN